MDEAGTEGAEAEGGERERDVAAIRAIYDAFGRLDVEGALPYISPSIRFMPHGTAQLVGRETPYHGHAGVRQYFADAARAWDDITLHAEDIRAVDGDIIVFGKVTGRVEGERFERPVVWIWQVRDGVATYMRVSGLEGGAG
ncbi:MAG TPA: nuclear transport factor 2 family protein [Solirubrobacteraceae bacterium]|nr:nuclear transport factor 2 family protein [Solirubrobacteraceae bacterium]